MESSNPERAHSPLGNGGSRPVPDPTVLTTQQLSLAIAAVQDRIEAAVKVLEERLHGIDRATELRLGGIEAIPDQIDEKVTALSNLVDERFASIAKQFLERDTRSERESRDNTVAVDAAFAAQKEAASEQNKSNTLAITKSEVATTETINKLAELFKTTTGGLNDKIDDQKERLTSIETGRAARQEVVSEHRSNVQPFQVIVTSIIGSAAFGALIAFLASR